MSPAPTFLEGGGELGALMRAYDWSGTPLGPADDWPQSLRTAVAILLRSPVPIVLLWGQDGVMLYNDAYSVFAGGRHPRLLGSKVLEGWPEVAEFNANVMRIGLSGGTLAYRDQHLVLYRNGVAEDVWMNLDYSPVPGESGEPAGVLAVVVETTARITGERRLRTLRQIGLRTASAGSVETVCRAALEAIALEDPADIPCARLYLAGRAGEARLIASHGPQPREGAMRALPLLSGETSQGNLVVGLNELEAPKPEYRDFLNLVAAQISSALASATTLENAERLRAIVETTPECVKVVAADGTLLQMNSPGLAMVGAAGGDSVIGRCVYDLIAPEHRERFRAFNEGICRGERGTLEFDIVGVNGRRRHMETHAAPLRQADGTLAQLALTRDVTERRRAAEALRDSERRYRAIVESQVEMVCRFRADGVILFANGAYARASGTTPEAIVGKSFWEFIPEVDQAGVRAMLGRLAPAAPEISIENRFETAEGPRWTLWTNRALAFDAAGRLLEAQSSGIDITDRKRAEEALREADRRKDEFIATLSHELRNPLAPLRNALHLLRLSGKGEAQGAPIFQIMERQVDHLVRLVDDLLEMSRISRGALELRRERLEVAAIVANAVETSQPLIDAARHRLAVSLPAEPLWVEGDAVRLAQILANLLDNAAKYTDAGGEITLAARRMDGSVDISVRDNGAGIAPEALPGLFEMFSRGDHAGGRGQGGLGIGLALARRLAQMHGGTLEGASEGRGRGAVFTLRLPLSEAPAALSAGREVSHRQLPPRRVLVVDDNRDAAESLGMLLKFLGADVRIAYAGPEAVDAFHAYDPSIVLLDVGMPGMDGYETARRLRERLDGKRVPIVAVTGWGQDVDRRRTREAGFDHHLVKPADIAALQSLLASLQ